MCKTILSFFWHFWHYSPYSVYWATFTFNIPFDLSIFVSILFVQLYTH